MSTRWLTLVLPILSLTACGADTGDASAEGSELSSDDGKADTAAAPIYYTVRPDLRRCVFPTCGGYWLKKLNSTVDEVYVPEIDFARAGLEATDLESFALGGSVVHGTFTSKTYGTMTRRILAADAAYAAGSDATASGTYYRLTDLNRTCFRAPCFNIGEDKLNWSSATRQLSDVTGALAADAVSALRHDDEILVAGTNKNGAQGAKQVAITAYWTRVRHSTAATCANVRCGAGTSCVMVQVMCITTPCNPVPTCVITDEHLVELAQSYAYGHGDSSYDKRTFDTEAQAYAAASTSTRSLLWLAKDGANNKFVWGYNDLWAERFEIDRITGDVHVTGEH